MKTFQFDLYNVFRYFRWTILFMLNSIFYISAQCPEGQVELLTQESVDNFLIDYPNCTELSVLKIGEYGNSTQITNLDGLINLTTVGGLEIISNPALSNLNGLINLTSIPGMLKIEINGALKQLSGLNGVSTVGTLMIGFNVSLMNLNGLNNLNTVFQGILIQSNESLISLEGLNSLTSVGTSMIIVNNPSITSLVGLELELEVQFLRIKNNGELSNLVGLNHITTSTIEISENESLISLEGLDITMGPFIQGSGIFITDNLALYSCSHLFLCDYILNDEGFLLLNDNMMGCNNEQEVLEGCHVLSEASSDDSPITIGPNPFDTKFAITIGTYKTPLQYQLIDFNGKVLLQGRLEQKSNQVNFTVLNSGIYILKIINPSNKTLMVRKIVKM